jgi:predicted ATPase
MDRRVRGRDLELDVVGELVGATAHGDGGVLLIEGPAGIGKTRMLAEAEAVARRAGVRVAAAEAFEGQRTVPFATLLTALLETTIRSGPRTRSPACAPSPSSRSG